MILWNLFFGLGIFMMIAMLLFMVFGILTFIFWVWMVVDCTQRKFKEKTDKLIWILILIFTNIIGALIYYLIIKRKE